MKAVLLGLFGFVLAQGLHAQNGNFETITLTSDDGLTITGDLYEIENDAAPIILLFHQAGNSRGEYRSIAPKLNMMGFHCLALDQRSGNGVNGVANETHKAAIKSGIGTSFVEAFPDLQAVLTYANENFNGKKIVWGSSYSASLVFCLAALEPTTIDGLLAFSPGEYFKMDNKGIAAFAAKVKCPVFVSSAKNEQSNWNGIYKAVGSEKTFYLPNTKGYHGSRALWPESEGNKKAWEAVTQYLSKFQS